MKKHSLLVALLCLVFLLASCSTLKQSFAYFNIIYPHMLSGGNTARVSDLYGNGIIGSWTYVESIQHLTMVGGAVASEDEVQTTSMGLEIYGSNPEAEVRYDSSVGTLNSTIAGWMSDAPEKYPNKEYSLKISADFTKIVMVKLEAYENADTETADCYLIVRTMEKEPVNECSVCFAVDGAVVAEQKVVPGEYASEPEAPSKDGYSFTGWEYEEGGLFDFSAPVSSDVRLQATWIEIQKVETYAYNFFDTRFYYTQCKDVQWYADDKQLHISGPAPLYCAVESRQLSVEELSDGAYICFAKTDENGYYSQTLYNADGSVKLVLSVKGRISYFGDYGFLYRADAYANNAWTEFCSYFYTNKGLNEDGSTPSYSDFSYVYYDVEDDSILENYGK